VYLSLLGELRHYILLAIAAVTYRTVIHEGMARRDT
jgi:hypothetical protein